MHFGNPVKYCCPTKCKFCQSSDCCRQYFLVQQLALLLAASYCLKQPSRSPDVATCTKSPITMFYFDTAHRECRPYSVAGCASNTSALFDEVQNRFATLKDCRARCETTGGASEREFARIVCLSYAVAFVACEAGESPLYRDESLEAPYLCASSENCPRGYICRLDRLFQRQVCCGKTQFGKIEPFLFSCC